MTPRPRPAGDFLGASVATLLAVIDRIIPEDDHPGALAAGADGHVLDRLAQSDDGARRELRAGLGELEELARGLHGVGFHALPGEARDELLSRVEERSWFGSVVELVAEGFYADPGYGNRDGCSWRMIGYEPRLPVPAGSRRSPGLPDER